MFDSINPTQTQVKHYFLLILIGALVILADPIINDLQLCEPFVLDMSRFGEACL